MGDLQPCIYETPEYLLKYIITPEYRSFSQPLQKILEDVKDRQAALPKKYKINQDYLLYHRENILIN
ncbi:hypothetical protein [Anabaena sp. UHCC 0451]|uniref:hypothetical protein n=1 Tax=Anabaena sp. UHCC 0451 TaxID=2055235 RepID=UPI002B1F8AF9|nr:hypothetical protein [Anabaena sp. UHCC 0451]MEA5576187.1 hypothetical protein [Anabaena sp. UHCC 0451]